jgi:2-keto-3-deoxy-L-rhamnonate aldolase RhmA
VRIILRFKAQEILHRARDNQLVIGAHVFFANFEIAEAFGFMGYDFVWIDGEHSAFDKEKTLMNIIAANSGGTASFVRVPWNDPVLIKPILEMGPDGIIIPMIASAEEARRAVAACMYPPEGMRGFGPRRANRYGTVDNDTYLSNVNQSFLRIMQIEHYKAVESLEEIMDVPGVDVIMVGPNDLSGSLGLLGQTRHPEVMKWFDKLAAKCIKANMPFGTSLGASDTESIKDWVDRGVSLIGCADDLGFVTSGGQEILAMVKGLRSKQE